MPERIIPPKTALLADIHGNSPALEAVIEDIQRSGCARVFVLGDIINGVDPAGCLALLRQWRDRAAIELTCLKGNAEAYLLTPDLGALPKNDEPWNDDLVELIQWYRARLTAIDLDWIASFADFVRWKDAGLAHDSPVDRLSPQSWHDPGIEDRYQEWFFDSPGIFPDMAEAEWEKLLACMEEYHLRQVFCAHTHVPFCQEIGEKLVCNVGSVGAPLDGGRRTGDYYPAGGVRHRQNLRAHRSDSGLP